MALVYATNGIHVKFADNFQKYKLYSYVLLLGNVIFIFVCFYWFIIFICVWFHWEKSSLFLCAFIGL